MTIVGYLKRWFISLCQNTPNRLHSRVNDLLNMNTMSESVHFRKLAILTVNTYWVVTDLFDIVSMSIKCDSDQTGYIRNIGSDENSGRNVFWADFVRLFRVEYRYSEPHSVRIIRQKIKLCPRTRTNISVSRNRRQYWLFNNDAYDLILLLNNIPLDEIANFIYFGNLITIDPICASGIVNRNS